ncbi:MAG: hypothetical protein KatS3mg005_2676 [Bryobacteraceae bacterium]|nr:MAG: hypothetical protein KatS3mg005_2676 [Bryobacteraceae bacterium]
MTRGEFEAIPWVQQNDATLCWAAALEWWGLATRQGWVGQNRIMRDCEQYWVQAGSGRSDPSYGTLGIEDMPAVAEVLRTRYGWAITAEVRSTDAMTWEFFSQHLPCFAAFPMVGEGECGDLEKDKPPDFHAIVVYGADREHLYFMDPSEGFCRDSLADLFACRGWLTCVAYRP